MPKKSKNKEKVPYLSECAIYGIFSFSKKKLVYVDLDQDNTWLEFDLNCYDPEKYSVVRLNVNFNEAR